MNKYGARKTVCSAGHTHGSKKEARRCDELHLLQRGGVIRQLSIQPQFWFQIDGQALMHDNGRRVGYKADFQYFEGDQNVVEETKGLVVRDWPLRKALFKACYPYIKLVEIH